MWSRAIAAFLILQLLSSGFRAERSVAAESPTITLEDDLVIGLDEDDVVLGRIVDVAVDSRDDIYVLDASAPTVHKFTQDGRYLASIGGPGEGPGEFNTPSCLTIGSDDRVYVSGGDLYVEVLAADGSPLERIKRVTNAPAQALAVDDHGDIYVVALDLLDQKMIHKYSGKSHELVESFCDSYAVGHDVDTREESIFAQGSIAVEYGRVFYVQSYPHKIRIFDLSGTLIKEFDARTAESKAPRRRFGANGVQYQVPASLSRTIIPLEGGEQLLTILALPFEGSGGTSYLDIYRQSDGARIASIKDPPTVSIYCRDSRGRLYSTEARDDVPVAVRYRLEGVFGASD
jgi:hypothetical protein